MPITFWLWPFINKNQLHDKEKNVINLTKLNDQIKRRFELKV